MVVWVSRRLGERKSVICWSSVLRCGSEEDSSQLGFLRDEQKAGAERGWCSRRQEERNQGVWSVCAAGPHLSSNEDTYAGDHREGALEPGAEWRRFPLSGVNHALPSLACPHSSQARLWGTHPASSHPAARVIHSILKTIAASCFLDSIGLSVRNKGRSLGEPRGNRGFFSRSHKLLIR